MQFPVCFSALLALCRAQEVIEIPCSVTQNGNQATYRVSDESRLSDFEASECYFFWTGENDSILADNTEKMSPVTKSSIDSLVTTECIEKVVLKTHCSSKTMNHWADFISNCTTTCAEKRLIHGDKKDSVDDKDEAEESTEWTTRDKIAAGLGGGLVGLVLLGGLIFVLYKLRV